MASLNPYFIAARPKTLTASLAPVCLGLALAAKIEIHPLLAILTILSALFLQVGTNFVNDYYDWKKGTDKIDRLGPTRVTQAGLLPPSKVKRSYIFCFILAFLCGLPLIYWGGTPILILGPVSILFAYLYTGGPFPLSYYGLGELLAYVFFGPIAVCGTYFLQTKSFSWPLVLWGSGPGLLASALMAINNIRDVDSDKKAGKKTIAVLLGQKTLRILCVLWIVLASLIPFLFLFLKGGHGFLVFPGLMFVPFRKTWYQILYGPNDKTFNNHLAVLGKYLFCYSLTFAFGIYLS